MSYGTEYPVNTEVPTFMVNYSIYVIFDLFLWRYWSWKIRVFFFCLFCFFTKAERNEIKFTWSREQSNSPKGKGRRRVRCVFSFVLVVFLSFTTARLYLRFAPVSWANRKRLDHWLFDVYTNGVDGNYYPAFTRVRFFSATVLSRIYVFVVKYQDFHVRRQSRQLRKYRGL